MSVAATTNSAHQQLLSLVKALPAAREDQTECLIPTDSDKYQEAASMPRSSFLRNVSFSNIGVLFTGSKIVSLALPFQAQLSQCTIPPKDDLVKRREFYGSLQEISKKMTAQYLHLQKTAIVEAVPGLGIASQIIAEFAGDLFISVKVGSGRASGPQATLSNLDLESCIVLFI